MNIRSLSKVHERLTHLGNRYLKLTDIFKKYHASIHTQLSKPPYESAGYIVSNYENNSFSVTYLNKEVVFVFELHEEEQGFFGKVSCQSHSKGSESEPSTIASFTFDGTGKTNVTGLDDPIILCEDEHLVELTLGILEKAWN